MIAALLDAALALLVLGLAAWSILARDAFASIVGFVVFGLLLMLVWMRLGAPDVAMTEGAVSGGLGGLLLLRAHALLDRSGAERPTLPARSTRSAAALLALLVTGGLLAAYATLPTTPPSLASAVEADLAATGLGNPVNAVLIGFRALDTLLEKVVLVFALVGVWTLCDDRAWAGRPRLVDDSAPPALAHFARLLPPIGVVVAGYVLWNGADDTGGAFPSGAILAATALLVVLAGLATLPRVAALRPRVAVASGPLGFLAIGLLGVPVAGAFLAFPERFAKPIIVAIEVLLVLSVAAILVGLVAGPPRGDETKEPAR